MALTFNGPILASKVLVNGEEVAENVTITLPEVNFQTVEFKALGSMELPVPLTDALQATINSVGLDKGLFKAMKLENQTYEFRFVQNVTKKSGEQFSMGCKAFLKAIPQNLPGGDLEVGSNFEGAINLAVTRYQLYVDGSEKILIDKLKNILKINGHDYAQRVTSLI